MEISFFAMAHNLRRVIGRNDLHFITFTYYQRRKFLASARRRSLAVQILGEVRERYKVALVGYVLMPDHVHLLVGESADTMPAKFVQIFKQRTSRQFRARKARKKASRQLNFDFASDIEGPRRFWQRRYHDFNVYSRAKVREKLDYMHANPVTAKLVRHPMHWPWSSWAAYVGKPALLAIDVMR